MYSFIPVNNKKLVVVAIDWPLALRTWKAKWLLVPLAALLLRCWQCNQPTGLSRQRQCRWARRSRHTWQKLMRGAAPKWSNLTPSWCVIWDNVRSCWPCPVLWASMLYCSTMILNNQNYSKIKIGGSGAYLKEKLQLRWSCCNIALRSDVLSKCALECRIL